MNAVRYAQWLSEKNFDVHFLCVEDSPIHQHLKESTVNVSFVRRNGKYFDFINAFRVRGILKRLSVHHLLFRDTRDMSLLASVKFLSPSLKLIYLQAMQLGVDKKDPLHTFRFRAIDAWIATLPFLKEQVLHRTHFPSDRIHVIPLGSDIQSRPSVPKNKSEARAALGIDESAFLCGIIGRIDPLKGQHIAINAIQQIKEESIHLLILGESTKNEGNQYEHDLKKKVRSLNLDSRVHFRPYHKEVSLFYAALDCFILASKGETFGTVTIEAMSFGLPIVGTNSSGTPEILENGNLGWLFEPDDSKGLSDALLEVYHYPEKAKNKGQKAKARFFEKYSKEASLDSIIEVLRKL